MEFTFKKVNNAEGKEENLVYIKEGVVVLIAKISDKIYTPNFSFVCFSNAEMAVIKSLVTEAKTNGTDRLTKGGRKAKDYSNEVYDIAIIELENGKLVDVSIKNAEHPLYGLSVKWIEQSNGTTQLSNDANFTYFPPNGPASYDLGFSRKKVKIGDTNYNKGTKSFVTTYGDTDTFLTVPSMGTSEGFVRAARGLKLLEDTIAFAGQHMTPVDSNPVNNDLMKALGANMPM
jgi:hypothetical protein